MRPSSAARPEYVAAFTELVQRIAAPLRELPRRSLPIKMYVAGGAATYFYTGARVSRDVDAAFSKRVALPDDLEVAYRDSDGAPRLLYFDSKISRLSSQDREDIIALGSRGLIKSEALRHRSEEALKNYVGDLDTLRGGIDFACRIVRDIEQRTS